MSNYDHAALLTRPTFYLSAPETTDKSGAALYDFTDNDLSAAGQPIIYKNTASFVMSDATNADIDGNPIFFNSTASFECVIVAKRPTEQVPILIDSDGMNALYIDPNGITVKLFFDNATSTYAKVATVRIKNWNVKMYVSLSISSTQAVISVNGQASILSYTDAIVVSSTITIGGGYTGYSYLIDGVGFYNTTATNKISLIDDPASHHAQFSGNKHDGLTTLFDGYRSGYKQTFELKDFRYSNDTFILSYYVNAVDEGIDYLSVTTNDESVTVSYDVDMDDFGEFTEYLLLGSISESTIRFILEADQVDSDFQLIIEGVYNGDVLDATPASLVLDGLALYSNPSESIVNYPDGVLLPGSSYTGTWLDAIPSSIEIVFKPTETTAETYVVSSTDGGVSSGDTGGVTGYTTYLNGATTTDMSEVKYNQWNHLVVTLAEPEATEFYLNSDDGIANEEVISYMSLTAYPNVLTGADAEELYNIFCGTDGINISDTLSTVSEGTFGTGDAFNYYSYAWAIVGAGGS
jgi:hypothetical protein